MLGMPELGAGLPPLKRWELPSAGIATTPAELVYFSSVIPRGIEYLTDPSIDE